MDMMETFTVNLTRAWGIPVGTLAICVSVITLIVHISFAVAVFRDTTRLPESRRPIFVGRIVWFLATLIGSVFVAGIYWVMHHSRLNQSVTATPPEN